MSSSENAGNGLTGVKNTFRSEEVQEHVLDVRILSFNYNLGLILTPLTGDLALNEVFYVVGRLVQRCDDIKFMGDIGRARYDTTVTSRIGGGVPVRLHHTE